MAGRCPHPAGFTSRPASRARRTSRPRSPARRTWFRHPGRSISRCTQERAVMVCRSPRSGDHARVHRESAAGRAAARARGPARDPQAPSAQAAHCGPRPASKLHPDQRQAGHEGAHRHPISLLRPARRGAAADRAAAHTDTWPMRGAGSDRAACWAEARCLCEARLAPDQCRSARDILARRSHGAWRGARGCHSGLRNA